MILNNINKSIIYKGKEAIAIAKTYIYYYGNPRIILPKIKGVTEEKDKILINFGKNITKEKITELIIKLIPKYKLYNVCGEHMLVFKKEKKIGKSNILDGTVSF